MFCPWLRRVSSDNASEEDEDDREQSDSQREGESSDRAGNVDQGDAGAAALR